MEVGLDRARRASSEATMRTMASAVGRERVGEVEVEMDGMMEEERRRERRSEPEEEERAREVMSLPRVGGWGVGRESSFATQTPILSSMFGATSGVWGQWGRLELDERVGWERLDVDGRRKG